MKQFRTAAAVLALATAFAARAESTTTFSGKVFTDYTFRQNIDEGTHVTRDAGTELDVKRFYFTVDSAFDDVWGARFRTDIGDLSKHFDVYVKNAYLEAKVAPELVVRAGAADLPWVPFVEDLYGFRYVENTLADRTKFANSADWGLHASGKVVDGVVRYAVSVVNGRGYADPTRSQAPTVEGRLGIAAGGLTVAVGGLSGKLGQNVVGAAVPNTASRANAVIAWVGNGLRAGVEGFYARDYSAAIVTGKAPQDKAVGGSGWLSYEILPVVSVFGRYDFVEPARDTVSALKDRYLNAGVQFKPAKPVDLALVYKHEQVSSGTLSTSNGTIGSTVAGKNGKYDEAGVFAQYSF